MRFCFYNPHTVDIIGANLFASLFVWGKPVKRARRLSFLLHMLRSSEYNAAIVIDGTVSSLPLRRLGTLFNNQRFIRLFSFFEIYAWCLINGLNPFKQTVLFSLDRLNPKTDVLFGFAFLGRTFLDTDLLEKSFFKRFTGRKLLHATHFYENTEYIANTIRKTNTRAMVSEVDVRRSVYFRNYFDYIDAICILPFALRDRYRVTTGFLSRKNKCVALGTLAFFPDGNAPTEDHFSFFKTNTLHPMRKEIFDHATELAPFVDSLIVTHKKKPQNRKRSIGEIMWANINPATKEYHSFDIVDAYNRYRMFVSPEETIGQPSVNTIEGMACGCAYIGLDDHMYEDLGFQKGVHYIPYDGTVAGLARVIGHYQSRPDELARIAAAGRDIVRQRCEPNSALRAFVKNLEVL